MAGETQIAALVREFRSAIGEAVSGLEDRLTKNIDKVAADTKEARDGVRDITATMLTQNVGAALEKLGGKIEAVEQGLRSDIVNQNARLKQEMTACFEDVDDRITEQSVKIGDQDRRLREIERVLNQVEGKNTVFGWMLRHMPGPLIGAVVGLLGALGFDKRF